jgi:hypothetical protein
MQAGVVKLRSKRRYIHGEDSNLAMFFFIAFHSSLSPAFEEDINIVHMATGLDVRLVAV